MKEPLEEDGVVRAKSRTPTRGAPSLYGWFLVLRSRPWFRFAFRAAIPIVVVIVVAIIAGSH